MTYQMIAFDMDGTLLRSDQTIDPGSLAAIAEASQAGKTVVLSTGRALSELAAHLPLLPSVRYGVLASGGLVYDFHEGLVLDKIALAAPVIAQVGQVLQDEDVFVLVMRDGQGYVQSDQFDRIGDYHMADFTQIYTDTAVFVPSLADLLQQGKFEKINIYFKTEDVREHYIQVFSQYDLILARAEAAGMELTAKGADKGEGLARLCQRLDLDLSQVIAVGDSDNDAPAFRRVGLGLAMANANDLIKSLAGAIVADHNNGGCGQAVRDYLLADQ